MSSKKFEYMVKDGIYGDCFTPEGNLVDSEDGLTYFGKFGWELVAIRLSNSSKGGYRFYFKREITE